MTGANFKYVYALILLMVTIAWAAFSIFVTYRALLVNTPVNIIVAAGADTLLGSLITWNSLVIQFYFRKAGPGDVPIKPPTQ